MGSLLSDLDLIDRIFGHIDGKTTDAGGDVWQEPVENYTSEERFAADAQRRDDGDGGYEQQGSKEAAEADHAATARALLHHDAHHR